MPTKHMAPRLRLYPLFDAAAPFVFLFYGHNSSMFNRGLDWMFQFWKGQYTICTGAEWHLL
jgi:hypothetical protein